MKTSYPDRVFQFWDFSVSHNQLVVRSPGADAGDANVDFHFRGVKLIDAPTRFKGLEIDSPTIKEVEDARRRVPSRIDNDWVRILASEGLRYVVVASHMKVSENRLPLMTTELIHATPADDSGEGQVN